MNNNKLNFCVDDKMVGFDNPVYFIADIAANHDGDIERAKDLIFLSAEAGANAAKFQHFNAKTIVSDYGFKNLSNLKSHQSKWNKSVFQVYEEASVNLEWTSILKDTCTKAKISFFSTPYSFHLLDHLDEYVPAYKIGSGDLTWIEFLTYLAKKNKPIFLATGASEIKEIDLAVNEILRINQNLCLMQCNTNYTGDLENFKYINLNVLKTFKEKYPSVILGLSDHTPGHATVLGSVALGAKVIEKHFTDSNDRKGPDHLFSMNPKSWKDMVLRTRELEQALGDEVKKVEENETETNVLQRRSLRSVRDIMKGSKINKSDFIPLRPCPEDSLSISNHSKVEGLAVLRDIPKGDYLKKTDVKL